MIFHFPVKVKITKNTENFLVREKVGKIPGFSEGRKMYPLTGGNIYIFPDGQRGKERRA